MMSQIRLGEIAVDVILKDIKNLHLGVYPPTGRVQISAPTRIGIDTIRLFAISKLDWIKQQQKKFREQVRETPREYLDRESHYVWGKRYLLSVAEQDHGPAVALKHGRMILTVQPGTDEGVKEAIVAKWYREQIKAVMPDLVARWEPILGLSVDRVFVRQMRTRWGSCNPRARTIRLNTELAKKPRDCLEYVTAHEMVHLREPRHGSRFLGLLDRLMPHWRETRALLNRLPARHCLWKYDG
jgi:predicted metal-dependent hydrolase